MCVVPALDEIGELALVEARAGVVAQRLEGAVGQRAPDAQPLELLGRLRQPQARVVRVELDDLGGELGEARVPAMAERADEPDPPPGRAAGAELLHGRRDAGRRRRAHVGLRGDPPRVGDVVVEVDEQHVALARRHHDERLARDRPARQPPDGRAEAVRAVEEQVLHAALGHRRLERRAAARHLRVGEARVGLGARPGHASRSRAPATSRTA
jgi:hypothetical protein